MRQSASKSARTASEEKLLKLGSPFEFTTNWEMEERPPFSSGSVGGRNDRPTHDEGAVQRRFAHDRRHVRRSRGARRAVRASSRRSQAVFVVASGTRSSVATGESRGRDHWQRSMRRAFPMSGPATSTIPRPRSEQPEARCYGCAAATRRTSPPLPPTPGEKKVLSGYAVLLCWHVLNYSRNRRCPAVVVV